jgi:hypothetical protein
MTEQLEASARDERAPAPNFSVREFARTAVGTHRPHLQLGEFDTQPLSAETLRVLSYARAVEHATMNHLRDVLVTPTHKDARVTAFLTTWAFEKFWIADALDAVLEKHERWEIAPQSARHTVAASVRSFFDRYSPIRESLVAGRIGEDIVAVHMAIGAIDSWLSLAAYSRIASIEPHPELDRILERIRGVKSRHLEFFAPQAEFRLDESARARALTTKRLKREPFPTGSKDREHSETSYFFSHLFAPTPHLLDEVDLKIDSLPGQSGLSLMRKRFEAVT